MRGDVSKMGQLVESYSTLIEQLERQIGQLSVVVNQTKNDVLPSDTIYNP